MEDAATTFSLLVIFQLRTRGAVGRGSSVILEQSVFFLTLGVRRLEREELEDEEDDEEELEGGLGGGLGVGFRPLPLGSSRRGVPPGLYQGFPS